MSYSGQSRNRVSEGHGVVAFDEQRLMAEFGADPVELLEWRRAVDERYPWQVAIGHEVLPTAWG